MPPPGYLCPANPILGLNVPVCAVVGHLGIADPDLLYEVLGILGEGSHQLVEHRLDAPLGGACVESADRLPGLRLDCVIGFHNRIKFNNVSNAKVHLYFEKTNYFFKNRTKKPGDALQVN